MTATPKRASLRARRRLSLAGKTNRRWGQEIGGDALRRRETVPPASWCPEGERRRRRIRKGSPLATGRRRLFALPIRSCLPAEEAEGAASPVVAGGPYPWVPLMGRPLLLLLPLLCRGAGFSPLSSAAGRGARFGGDRPDRDPKRSERRGRFAGRELRRRAKGGRNNAAGSGELAGRGDVA